MRLDRNIPKNAGHGKYAVLKLRNLALFDEGRGFSGLPADLANALDTLGRYDILDWGRTGTDSEFFLIRLKDEYSLPALKAYADAAEEDDFEWACEVRELANRAGKNSEFCKKPD